MKDKTVFLDRDGTIIDDVGYLGDPEGVRLLPGAADAIRRMARAGFQVIVVSNQSGIARGMFDEDALSRVHAQMVQLLETQGARLDGAYYCPYLPGPEATVEAYRRDSELRKPGPGMLIQASQERSLNLSQSWMIGDSLTDVQAGLRAGCATILLNPNGASAGDVGSVPTHTAGSLLEACDILEREMKSEKDGRSDGTGNVEDREVVQLLGKIHHQLERAHRSTRQHDFSVVRLFGTLIQMFAVVAVLWGVIGLMNDQADTATARFTLACFLQLASLSAFAADRFR